MCGCQLWIFIFMQFISGISVIAFVISLHVTFSTCHFSAGPLLRSHVVIFSFLGISAFHLVTSRISCFPQVSLSLLHRSSSQQVLESLCQYVTSPHLLKSWSARITMSVFHFSPSPHLGEWMSVISEFNKSRSHISTCQELWYQSTSRDVRNRDVRFEIWPAKIRQPDLPPHHQIRILALPL